MHPPTNMAVWYLRIMKFDLRSVLQQCCGNLKRFVRFALRIPWNILVTRGMNFQLFIIMAVKQPCKGFYFIQNMSIISRTYVDIEKLTYRLLFPNFLSLLVNQQFQCRIKYRAIFVAFRSLQSRMICSTSKSLYTLTSLMCKNMENLLPVQFFLLN